MNQWLTISSRVLPQKLSGSQLVKKFPTLYGTWRFNTEFARASHLSLSRARSILSMLASYQRISSRPCEMIRNIVSFYGEELSAPRLTPNLEHHPMSVVRDDIFNIFAATLHTVGRSSTRYLSTRHAVVTGTHSSRGRLIQGHHFIWQLE